jgi:hypothetical protein
MPEIRCRTSGSGRTWSEVPKLDNSTLDEPTDVFDRDGEWAGLTAFALSPLPGLRIAVVSDWFYDEVVRHHPAVGLRASGRYAW